MLELDAFPSRIKYMLGVRIAQRLRNPRYPQSWLFAKVTVRTLRKARRYKSMTERDWIPPPNIFHLLGYSKQRNRPSPGS